jgi:uncharacterized protein
MPVLAALSPAPAPPATLTRRWFAGSAVVVALHWLDVALTDRWPGESVRAGAPAAIAAVVFAAAAAVAWPRLPRGPRALAACVAGLIVLAAGGLAVWRVSAGDAVGGAWSGLLLVPAGLAMLTCAVVTLRGGPRRAPLERWARRVAGLLAVVLAVNWLVLPVGFALYATGKPASAVPAGALGLPHQNVSFTAADGVRLAGWYVPSRNRAAILLVHGGGGSRAGAVQHARMLARRGYGVLLYDARGRGESDGRPDAIGWTWQSDVAGALRWLDQRPDVDPEKVGGLGLSTGAEALLQAAAQRHDLHAVVADGAEARNLTEAARVAGPSDLPYWAAFYATTRVLTAAGPAPDLGRLVSHLHAPALIIAAGRDQEARFGDIYAHDAHGRAELWHVPDAGHTRALRTHPAAYTARVTRFFAAALHPTRP